MFAAVERSDRVGDLVGFRAGELCFARFMYERNVIVFRSSYFSQDVCFSACIVFYYRLCLRGGHGGGIKEIKYIRGLAYLSYLVSLSCSVRPPVLFIGNRLP